MTIEDKLITKSYYELLINQNEKKHPIEQLGELFLEEQKQEIPDASFIRYSQGEVYFHNRDYEAAIYKWENVHNELKAWASKNSADAYMELELFTTAEELYKSIQTDSLVLRTEVMLQLFSLYLKQENFQQADKVIKETVALNPSYPDVTTIAHRFYEQQKDWQSAIDLAIEEGIRTESLNWFEILKSYVHKGYTKDLAPNYFHDSFVTIAQQDLDFLEQFIVALDKTYQEKELYFEWIKQLNQFFLHTMLDEQYVWMELPFLYQSIVAELLSGKYFIREIAEIVPDVLTVWVKLVKPTEGVIPAAAIFAWNEMMPSTMDQETIRTAEHIIFHAENDVDVLEKSQQLCQMVMDWAAENQLEISGRLQFLSNQLLESERQHIGIISMAGSDKSLFINSLLNEPLLQEAPSSVMSLYTFGESVNITEYKDSAIREITTLEEYTQIATQRRRSLDILMDVQLPNRWLANEAIGLLDTPDLSGARTTLPHLDDYFYFVDSLLYVLDEDGNLTDKEIEVIHHIKKNYPGIPLHFVVMNWNQPEQADSMLTNVLLNEVVPNETPYQYFDTEAYRRGLYELLQSTWKVEYNPSARLKKYLYILKKMMAGLLEQRVKMENNLAEAIQSKEDLLARVNGAIHQLEDLEREKIDMISQSYILVREEIKKEIVKKLPKLLQECSTSIDESSDFSKIHQELNKEMNKKIGSFINTKILPDFLERINEWLLLSKGELQHSKHFLEEISEGFNAMMGTETLQLPCDFKVVEDWQRDIDRLTSRIYVPKENILLRFTPSQVLLKSAGKLLNAFSQNKSMLAKRYKSFIESEDYLEVAQSVADNFVAPFVILEQGLERDVTIFFKESFSTLKNLVEDTKEEVANRKMEMEKLKENPEAFRDPLTIFEIILLQYKYILEAKEMVKIGEY
ncbi:GTP-binding protein [Caldibacillus lycopersici]|uniref:GTP-binding protein n=1 Tax=Perspicuibacillus lycopersici TaxID=1325689 RepID=A0AAE3IUJ6_9BACI|nr:GTP-binding protein [Perspicuibacillus lycopersici]MCU9614462.1 GTP-binding protein [Perspicuibacillus lycopersici]